MKLPYTPGVYFFKSADGTIVYIGKAKNLHDRLRGHPMLEKADQLDWQETGSEIEALILESQWIKKYRPKYNISLRDDKNYVYVTFTDEEFPKIFVTHRNGIGPFTSSSELRTALRQLRKLFPYCTCKQKHNRPCLNAHIGKCIGFCCLKVSSLKFQVASYRKNIKMLKDILSGKRISIVKQFPRTFENIKVIKEISGRESALTQLMKLMKLTKLPARIEGYDVSNIQGNYATGAMVVFENGYPNTSEYRKFKIRGPDLSRGARRAKWDDTLMLREILTRRFRHTEWPRPDLILIDGGKAQLNVARYTLHATRYTIPVISIAKGRQEIFSTTLAHPIPLQRLATSVQRLILHLDSEAHRFAIGYYRRLHRRANIGERR